MGIISNYNAVYYFITLVKTCQEVFSKKIKQNSFYYFYLFYFLFKIAYFFGIKKLNKRNPKSITKHFYRYNSGI